MTRVFLDSAALARFNGVNERAVVCDEAGRTIGYFTPAVDGSLYEGVDIPISEDELDGRERAGGAER